MDTFDHSLALHRLCRRTSGIFLARGLSHQGSQLDDGEFLEVFELGLDDAIDWVRQGKINDSKTIVGLFWLEKILGGWALKP